MRTAVRIRVRGLVHGVYFRGSLSQLANAENVTGWVRNVADGSVEAVLEGDEDSLDRLVDWVRHGPPGARVDSVQVTKTELRRAKGFKVLG
jgi:acylphosphatase